MKGRTTALAGLLLVLAGCIAPEAPIETATDDAAGHARGGALAAPLDTGLRIDAKGCSMAGGVSQNTVPTPFAHDLVTLPEPFEFADTMEYLAPAAGEATTAAIASIGVAHVAYHCEGWTINGNHRHEPNGGWIGLVVKPPTFEGLDPADRNYLLATLATRDPTLTAAVEEAGMFVFPGIGHVFGQDLPTGWAVGSVVETAGDGIYQTDMLLEPAGEAPPLIRLWMIVEKDGALHPAHLDLAIEGGTWFFGRGLFSHQFTADHVGNRADAPTGAMGVRDFAFAATLTIRPEVTDGMWAH